MTKNYDPKVHNVPSSDEQEHHLDIVEFEGPEEDDAEPPEVDEDDQEGYF